MRAALSFPSNIGLGTDFSVGRTTPTRFPNREDRPGEMERLYSFDQPHVATVTASYLLTPTWEVGAKWQYRTGNPYTPVIDAEIVPHPDTGSASLQPYLRRNQFSAGAAVPPLRPSYQQVVHLSALAMGDLP